MFPLAEDLSETNSLSLCWIIRFLKVNLMIITIFFLKSRFSYPSK